MSRIRAAACGETHPVPDNSSEPAVSFAAAGAFVVFGAAGGIGRAVVCELEARGAAVVACVREPGRLAETGAGHRLTLACDVTVPGQIDACLQQAKDRHGRIAGVTLCVGSILLKPAHLTTDEDWQDVLRLNLTPAFAVVRAAARLMRDGGAVVLCSSAAATVGMANHEAIAAAKAGVEGLVRAAAATYAARGLRCHAVAPGLVRTALASPITANAAALETSTAMHPVGRIGEPEDVASAIVWLLDPRNTWISGEVLHVDGGLAGLRATPRRR